MITSAKSPSTDLNAKFLRLSYRGREWLISPMHRIYESLYYHVLSRAEIPFAPGLSQRLAALALNQERGDVPVPKEVWEAQYRKDQWSFLRDLEQVTRYSVIAGYVHALKHEGSLLDVGCGEAVLLDRLFGVPYAKFVGIDISRTAVERAQAKHYPRSLFMCADAREFVAEEHFDAIIFNEVLYYFPEPVEMMRKYSNWLKPDGVLITSLYGGSDRARAIGRWLKKDYREIDEVEISGHGKKWIVDVFSLESAGSGESHGS